MSNVDNEQDAKKIMGFFSNSIKSNIELLNKHKKILIQYILKITDYPTDFTVKETSDSIVKFLSDIKEHLSSIEECISTLTDFHQKYNCLEISNDIMCEYINISTKVSETIIKIDDFLINAVDFTILNFCASDNKDEETKNKVEETHSVKCSKNKDDHKSTDNDTLQNTEIVENTLIISETKKSVTLPYTVDILKNKLKDNPEEYANLEDVISKDYTVPLDTYKNYSLARFKEAFNLIMHREKGNLKQALDLGLELFFNSNLHPAIITACKNLDELDIYLDYLENGETHKFSCFNIVFDIAPLKTKM